MNRYRIALVALVVASATMSTQAAQKAQGAVDTARPCMMSSPAAKDIESTITQLERDWTTAIVKRDQPALERLLAVEFNGTSATGHTFPKTAALDDLKSGKYVVESMTLDEISVNVYGDVAVAFTSQNEKSHYAGRDTSGHYIFTDVWANKDGRWQVVASHGARLNDAD